MFTWLGRLWHRIKRMAASPRQWEHPSYADQGSREPCLESMPGSQTNSSFSR